MRWLWLYFSWEWTEGKIIALGLVVFILALLLCLPSSKGSEREQWNQQNRH